MTDTVDENGKHLLFGSSTLNNESQTPNLLTRLISQIDHFRLPLLLGPRANWRKEWHHFCILGSHVQTILNLNLSTDAQAGTPPGKLLARVVLLVHEDAWEGDLDSIPVRDVVVHSGLIDLQLGHNSVCFKNGMFELSVALQDRPVGLLLRLRPITLPLLMRSNTSIGSGTINWLVVPKLLASGTITIGQRVHVLSEAAAYHDHNWGSWLWGHDFAWEWGFGLPERADVPWSLVFERMTNRMRNRVLGQICALWKNEKLYRFFTQDEIEVRPNGYLSPSHLTKFPRVMALVTPECTTDVPRFLDITARAGDDYLLCHFEAQDVAQIVIPNDTDLGTTIVNEVTGYLKVQGEVKGESVEMRGNTIFEFLT